MLPEALAIVVFALAGVSLKAADEWGEANLGLRSYLASAAAAFCFWYMLKLSPSTSALGLAIIFGNLAAGKVDRANLIFGLILTATLAVLLGFTQPTIPALILLTFLAALDEYVHGLGGILSFRPALKIGVVVAGLLGWVGWPTVLALFAFDLAYEAWGRWRPA
ncbi:MAG: hypothetical protein ACXQTV_00630 [Candidatus Hecatellaceae archaeon]